MHLQAGVCQQEVNISTLCNSVVELAQDRCSQLLPKAQFIQKTFTKAFSYFARCHSIYDSSRVLEEKEIDELGK